MAEFNVQQTPLDFNHSQSQQPRFQQSGGQQNFQPFQPYLLTQNYSQQSYRQPRGGGRPFYRRGRGRLAPNFNQGFAESYQNQPLQPPQLDFSQSNQQFGNYGGYGQVLEQDFFLQGQPQRVRGRGFRSHSQRGPFRGQSHQPVFRGAASSFGNERNQDVGAVSSNNNRGRSGEGRFESGRGNANKIPPKKNRNDSSKTKNRSQYQGSKDTQTGSMIEQLTEGTYECTVCCETVRCDSPIWSCQECYNVFHMRCIKKWAKSPAAAAEGTDGWQCPMCRNISLPIPYTYKCFCTKMRDPPYQPGEMPHSCGEVCRRKRSKTNCVHPCNILCHPGPCPPCPASIKQTCLCGGTTQTIRCGTAQVVRCEGECGKTLNCGIHECEAVCHSGKCEPCQVELQQECYCGKDNKLVLCGLDESGNPLQEGPEQYSCHALCERTLACDKHTCTRPCHPGPCYPCSLTPDMVTHCPCGQTKLSELTKEGQKRESCLDPIPTCENTCSKPLMCGGEDIHTCKKTCHEGACKECSLTSTIRCRCGHRMIDVSCRDLVEALDVATGEVSMACDRKCTKKKDCGKHKCNTKCCMDKNHHCGQICGRMLNCGLHRCEEMCHPGNCVRCLNASFDEHTCHCGATVMMPPIQCGTRPPECPQLCARRHDCNHTVRHNCHYETACPPCAELSSKMCMGNHEKRYNIPCHIKDISCGHPCEKKLQCQMHNCKKICHKGTCEACKHPCLAPRPECGHPCAAPCHVGNPCPPTQCKAKFSIHCACGNRSEATQCLQGGDDAQLNEAFQRLATYTLAGQRSQSGGDVDISQMMALRNSKKQRQLECDQQCSILARNRRLASALQINPESSKFTPTYNMFLKEQAKKTPAFVAGIEKEIAALVASAQASKHPSRSHVFPSMNRDQRRVVHELSEMYGCESQSYDQEPKRNVVTTARKSTCFIPSATLSSVVGDRPKAPPPILHTKHQAPRHLTTLSKMQRPDSPTGPTSPPPQAQVSQMDDFEVPDSWEVR
ncbi:transcriptional repressor NF-X1-like [Asterias rubens]|uniref:transcriptional repressor NF-X1-like n=1 Tax=Asterias rubens TaxID=7604 RepID=UPI0014559EE6|nr:transcriptional repressor NF-X1-like [Asterias rubens]XP_033639928.1 transcriptional repressor NF-X1-like [Asterias rubens]